jgi:hypothetical protein
VRQAERAVRVGIVVAIAAAVRIGFVHGAVVQSPLRADAGQYAQYAANLWQHGVYSLDAAVPPSPDAFRSPGYPTFLWLCRALAGDSWQSFAVWLQVALGTATVLLAYRLARLLLGFGASIAAAVAVALSPHLVVTCAYVLTECVTTFVVVLGAWLALGARSSLRAVAGSFVLGAAVLCNEALVVLPFAVFVATIPGRRLRAFVLLLLACLPLGAWSVRNHCTELARRGSERAIASISHGSYPGMVYRDPRFVGYPYRDDPAQPEFGSSWQNLRRVLGERVAAEPLRYVRWFLFEKPLWIWRWPLVQGRDVNVYEVANSPYEQQPVMAASHTLMRWMHWPLMGLAFGAVVVALWRRRRVESVAVALATIVLLATLAYLPVIPDPRYLNPVRPVLFVLAFFAVERLLRRLRPRTTH